MPSSDGKNAGGSDDLHLKKFAAPEADPTDDGQTMVIRRAAVATAAKKVFEDREIVAEQLKDGVVLRCQGAAPVIVAVTPSWAVPVTSLLAIAVALPAPPMTLTRMPALPLTVPSVVTVIAPPLPEASMPSPPRAVTAERDKPDAETAKSSC